MKSAQRGEIRRPEAVSHGDAFRPVMFAVAGMLVAWLLGAVFRGRGGTPDLMWDGLFLLSLLLVAIAAVQLLVYLVSSRKSQ